MKISDLSLSPLSSPSIKLPIHLPHSLPPQPHPTRLLLSLFWENGKHPSSTPPSPLSLSSLSLEISSWSRATMANRTSDLLRRVDSALQLDENALLRYASANVDGFPLSPSTFTVSQVSFSLHFLSLSIFCSAMASQFLLLVGEIFSSGMGNRTRRIFWKRALVLVLRRSDTFWGRSLRGSCWTLLTPSRENSRFNFYFFLGEID